MENPFESGHIKNYILFYASIVVIMILFFIASSLFNDTKVMKKKIFNSDINHTIIKKDIPKEDNKTVKFKLMERVY